jgi:aspartate racemase
MKTLGLLGGMGWISSAEYYRIINEEIQKRAGGLQFARCILYSFNYDDIHGAGNTLGWEGVYGLVRDTADKLALIGAEGIVLCANTSHIFADRLSREITIPLIHIASATTAEVKRAGLKTVGLLGTRPTMERDFYSAKLKEAGVDTIVPAPEEREFIHATILNELLRGRFVEESRSRILQITEDLCRRGAEGIVLGCAEIPMIVKEKDAAVPVFNTLRIHALAAVDFALSGQKKEAPSETEDASQRS